MYSRITHYFDFENNSNSFPFGINKTEKVIPLRFLDKTFNNIQNISNDDDLLGALLYLPINSTFKIEYLSYVIFYFPDSHKSFLLSKNQALDFEYIEVLLKNYENNDNNSFSINTIKKLSKNRLVIKIPSELYVNFSNSTFNCFQNIIDSDYVSENKSEIIKEQVTKLLEFLGLKGNVFPQTYKQFISKI
jgi:hypothetical protein